VGARKMWLAAARCILPAARACIKGASWWVRAKCVGLARTTYIIYTVFWAGKSSNIYGHIQCWPTLKCGLQLLAARGACRAL